MDWKRLKIDGPTPCDGDTVLEVPNAAAGGQSRAGEAGANLTAVLADQRATAQAQLDDAMAALQRYSRIKGVRKSDIARASLGPALLKKRLDDIDARIAAANAALSRGEAVGLKS